MIYYPEKQEVVQLKKLKMKSIIFKASLVGCAHTPSYAKIKMTNKNMISTVSQILMVEMIELKHQDLFEC